MSTNAEDVLKDMTGGPLTFGRALAAIRQCENMSQAECARLLNVSRQYLCDVENGRTLVSPKQAARFAEIFKYSEKQFIKLALQDFIEKEGFHFIINIIDYPHTKKAIYTV